MLRPVTPSLVFVFFSIFCFYACRSKEPNPALPAEHLAIAAHESIRLPDDITVTADSVSVFICPENACCFAPNSASVKLILSKNTTTHSVRLWTFIPNYDHRRSMSPIIDSARVEFSGQPYKVILRDGQYRRGTENTATPEVIVQVSRL